MADINLKMKLDGESDFRRAVKDCNAELKNMQSELKLVDAQAQGQANTLENLEKKYAALEAAQESAAKKQEVLAEIVEKATLKRDAAKEALEQLTSSETASAQEIEKAQAAYQNAETSLNNWETQLNKAATENVKLSNELEQTNTYLEEARSSADGCATSIDEYGKKTSKASEETDQLLNVMSKTSAMEAIKGLADEVSGAMTKLGDAAYDAMIEIDAGYDTIITKTGATGEALAGLEQSASNVYGSMPTSMDAVSTAIGEVNTRFGATGTALETLSEQFIQFAEINGSDVNNSIDTVDRILTQYGEDVSKVGGFLGQMTTRSQETGKSTDSLMQQLDQNAGLLKTFGLGLEESVNLLSNFETNGIQASTALQGMKRAASTYAQEGDDMRTGLKRTIDAIKNAADETEAYSIAQETFGTRGFTAMADAIRDGRFSLDDLGDSFEKYTTTVEDTYSSTKNAWDDWTTAQNNLKVAGGELSAEFYGALSPAIESITGVVQDATRGFQELPEEIQTVLGVAGGLTVEAGKLAPALFEVGTQLATLKAAKQAADSLSMMSGAASGAATNTGKLSGALSGIGGPTVLAAMGAAVGALVLIEGTISDLGHDVDELVAKVNASGDKFSSEMSVYKNSVENAASGMDKFNAASEGLKKSQDAHADSVENATELIDKYNTVVEDTNKEIGEGSSVFATLLSAFSPTLPVLVESIDSYQKLDDALEKTSESLHQASGAEIEFQNAQRDALLEMSEGNDTVYNATANTLAMADSLGRTSGEYANVTEALYNLKVAHDEQVSAINAEIQSIETEMQNLQAEYDAAYESAYNSLTQQFGLFEQVKVEGTTSVEEMTAALQSQVDYMTEYGTNLQKAAEMGISDGLLAQLSDGSVQSAQYLAAIVEDGGKNIELLNQKFSQVENGKQTMSKIMAENVTDFSGKMSALETRMDQAVQRLNKADAAYISGAQTIQGYIRGSEAYRSAIIAQYTSLGNAATTAFNSAVKINSPSKVFFESGVMTMKGAILGAESMRDSLEDTYASLSLASLGSFEAPNLSNTATYYGATRLNNNVAVYIGDKELTGIMAAGVIKNISDNQRNSYAGIRR